MTGPSSHQPVQVLLVDDSAANRLIIGRHLTSSGLEVDEADGGAEALRRIAITDYDLLVLDWHMPDVDGLAITAHVRDREREPTRHTPIVCVTASTTMSDRRRCFAAGVDGFVAKPVTRAELMNAVSAVLGGSEFTSAPAAERGRTWAVENNLVTDPEVLTTLVDQLGTATVVGVVEAFLRDLGPRSQSLIQAMASAKDDEHAAEETHHQAHSLRSPCFMLGATRLARLCQEVESEGATTSTDPLVFQTCVYETKQQLERWVRSINHATPEPKELSKQ